MIAHPANTPYLQCPARTGPTRVSQRSFVARFARLLPILVTLAALGSAEVATAQGCPECECNCEIDCRGEYDDPCGMVWCCTDPPPPGSDDPDPCAGMTLPCWIDNTLRCNGINGEVCFLYPGPVIAILCQFAQT